MTTYPKEVTSHMKVAIIGGGSFGTAIAVSAARNNHAVQIHARDEKTVHGINSNHHNPKYLSEFTLPLNISATQCIFEATNDADIIFLALPVQQVPLWLEKNTQFIPPNTLICNTAKGLYGRDESLLSDAVRKALARNQPYAVLSGPSFAKEILQNHPTAVIVASQYLYHAVFVSRIFSTPHFRCHPSQDVLGTELGGALKNPLAIGAGIIDGLDMGVNTKAAFITLSSVELKLLCHAMGGQSETIAGLAGIGDLMLTCFGELSRNHSMGYRLAKGETSDSITSSMTVEGVHTARVVVRYADMCGLELPIFRAVNEILQGKVALKDAGFLLLGNQITTD